jgi:hypothetical protein
MAVPTTPDASSRTIAPRAPGLELRNAPVAAFHVTNGAFRQTGSKPASLAFRNRRFLTVRNGHRYCRRDDENRQEHRHSMKV